MPRGRPFQPGNNLGRGRPKGSRNKRNQSLNQLLEAHREAVVRKGLLEALKADGPCLRMLLGYYLPPPKEVSSKIGALPMGTAKELCQTSEVVCKKLASGEIPVSAASQIFDVLEKRRRIVETEDLALRLDALERLSQTLPHGQ